MKLDSVRALKAELSAEVIAAAGDTPEAYSFYAATPAPMPQGVALGVAQSVTATANDEYVLAIRTSDPAAADAIKARAAGEANVRLLTVTKRTTPGYFQGTRRPLEPGLQVGMASKNFVGTLGCFVRDADGTLYALSNSHVLADEGRASPGHVFGQPFGTSPVGVLARFIPFSTVAPNLVDCALGRLDKTQALVGFDAALGTIPLYGTKRVTADLLGADVWKVGRTTGARKGKVTTVEIDGLPVGYDSGVLHFNDQLEVSGGPATDFSAAGDSGSLIVLPTGYAIALLFAGGRDSTGEDFTYGNYLSNVLNALGVSLA